MDLYRRLELIKLPPVEEIITEEELISLLETKSDIVAYDGFEPSGLLHLGSGLLRAIKTNDFIEANIKFIIYIADWFAYLNNKFGGDMELIRKAGEYFIEGWKACGMKIDKVDFVWASEVISDKEYWETFLKISKFFTVNRVKRAVTIAGRKGIEAKNMSLLIYPLMQVTDIFMLNDKRGVDICQLGMDQRKANMLAREVAESLSRKKPVVVHHHLLLGLQANEKMSKSKPETAIFIHDKYEDIERKILSAYCPPKQVDSNPILEICKYIIFRKFDRIIIKREEKYGGNLEILNYNELERRYIGGEIHPLDLKRCVIEYLNEILEPIRDYFRGEKSEKLYEIVKNATITR